jgi:hypothetical protein
VRCRPKLLALTLGPKKPWNLAQMTGCEGRGPSQGHRPTRPLDALAGTSTSSTAMGRGATVFDANGDGVLDVFVGASTSGIVYGYLGGGL